MGTLQPLFCWHHLFFSPGWWQYEDKKGRNGDYDRVWVEIMDEGETKSYNDVFPTLWNRSQDNLNGTVFFICLLIAPNISD